MNWSRLLLAILVCEIVGGALFAWQASQRVVPPAPNLQKLDPLTAQAVTEIREAAIDGNSREWRELAEAYLGNGFYAEAEQCFRHASVLNPDDLQATYGRGFCLERVGRTDEAINVLKQVAAEAHVELQTTCWYQIGRCYLRQEDVKSAEDAFRRVSEFPAAAYQLAKLLHRSGRSGEAAQIVASQREVLPNSLKLIQLGAHAAESLGDTALAAELRDREERSEYQLSLEYSQSFVTMFAGRYGLQNRLSRALELRSSGTLMQRKRVLDGVLEVIRENELWQYRPVLLAAAHVELGLGNLAEVERLISEIRMYSQDGADLLELEGLVLAAQGKVPAAVNTWQRACELSPSIEVIDEILQSNSLPEDQVAVLNAKKQLLAGLSAYRVNQPELARPHFEEAVRLNPTDARTWFYIGEVERLAGAIDNAATAYAKCVERNPNHGRALRRLQSIRSNTIP